MKLFISIPLILGIFTSAFFEYGAAWIVLGVIAIIILSSLISKR